MIFKFSLNGVTLEKFSPWTLKLTRRVTHHFNHCHTPNIPPHTMTLLIHCYSPCQSPELFWIKLPVKSGRPMTGNTLMHIISHMVNFRSHHCLWLRAPHTAGNLKGLDTNVPHLPPALQTHLCLWLCIYVHTFVW